MGTLHCSTLHRTLVEVIDADWAHGRMNDSEDRKRFSPRTVKSETRLYSPFGIGTSVDFKYHYHNRWGRADEQFAAMGMYM